MVPAKTTGFAGRGNISPSKAPTVLSLLTTEQTQHCGSSLDVADEASRALGLK